MNLFEIVKYGVGCREAAERYGVEVNHYGMALCPFHNDRHPSLYVADDHYHCFACGEHGDVIDFAAKLFGLPLYEAAQKLAADFHLTPDKPPSAAALHAKRIQTEAQQLRENERLCFPLFSMIIVPLLSSLSPNVPRSRVSDDSFITGALCFCVSDMFLNPGSRTAETDISLSALTLSPGYIPRYTDDCVSP